MTIELNHTIVPAHDPKASAQMSDAEFDAAFARIVAAGVTYFRDPDGHLMEILTPAA